MRGITRSLAATIVLVTAACAPAETTVRLTAAQHAGEEALVVWIRILDADSAMVTEEPLTSELLPVTLRPGEYVFVLVGRGVAGADLPPEPNRYTLPGSEVRGGTGVDDMPGAALQECRRTVAVTRTPLIVLADVTRHGCSIDVRPDSR